MKKVILTSLSILLLGVMLSNISCEKLEVKRITKLHTGEVLDITHNFANAQGLIIDVSDDVQEIGHCWDTLSDPDINNSKEVSTDTYSKGAGIQSAMTNLLPGYNYYVRAYAITSKGQVYGEEISFTTSGQSLITITSPISTSSWAFGSTQQITWTTNINENVRIELMQGANMVSLISSSAVSNMSFSWEIPPAEFNEGTYYIQVSSVNDTGIKGVSEEFEITATTGSTDEITDSDGNTYQIVKIGDQWWMAENFAGKHDKDGVAITNYAYNDNESNVATYGRLYTWADAMLGAPTGWHLPTDEEWKQLEIFSGMVPTDADGTGYRGTNEGSKLAGSSTLWNDGFLESNAEFGTYGFSLFPGGFRNYAAGAFENILNDGNWWSATEGSSTEAWCRNLFYNYPDIHRGISHKFNGFSVRYIKDSDKTVQDIDGNIYDVVTIGTQQWMKQNLKVTKYSTGTVIPLVTDNTAWGNLADDNNAKAFCYYGNSDDNAAVYGALYTWAAAMNGNASSTANPSGIQGACPTGWHLPSDDEWKELEMHLDMSQTEADGTGWRGTGEGGKLKDTGTTHWISPNTGATNESGFTALPGGFRSYSGGGFANLNYYGYWLTSTEFDGTSFWYRYLYHDNIDVRRGNFFKSHGFSVRCIKD